MNKIILYIVFIIFFWVHSYSENENNHNHLYPSIVEKNLYEIGGIKFIGNTTFTEDELLKIISLKPTSRSIFHRIFQYYKTEGKRNRATPPLFITSLSGALKTMENEIWFFDPLKARDDVERIKRFYDQNGFHKVKVSYSFKSNPLEKINVLTFDIIEGERWKISNVKYYGLDSLPDDLKDRFKKNELLKPGNYFNEVLLTREVSQFHNILLNSGYYYSNFEIPLVTVDTIKKTDSITVKFELGNRLKFGRINFIDSINNQKAVGQNMKVSQLDFKAGEWYSIDKIRSSRTNLLSLGTFESVNIDSSSKYDELSDSVMPFVIKTIYKKQQEWSLGGFLNKTVDNFINAGIDVSYFHRNIFGAAQAINPFFRIVWLNIGEALIDKKQAQNEYQFGINFAQPLLWTIDVSRWAFSLQMLLSKRTIYNQLEINSFNIYPKFPVRLPVTTYINNMSIDFNFEREVPTNYSSAIESLIRDAKTAADSNRIREAAVIYGNLDNYYKNKNPLFSSVSTVISLISDTRDNPFQPKIGHFAIYSLELPWIIFGNNKFLRIQFGNYWYWTLSPQAVLALKQREGAIYWWDKSSSYIPFERQFFAGGANSVRGWSSRRLRYTKSEDNTAGSASDFARNFVGNAVIIEGSLEYRFRMLRPQAMNPILADQIANLGFAAFFDWGNAFHWLRLNEKGEYIDKYNFLDYINGIALAFGVGLRYDTPVGPLRLDFGWPLYDPMNTNNKWIFKRENAFSKVQFHIGLGHAF